MTTPLQQAAQAVIDFWENPKQLSMSPIELKLRKALDAELQQSVEPVAFMRPTVDGYDPVYRDAKYVVASKATGATHWDKSGWVPLYLHPPQQAIQGEKP